MSEGTRSVLAAAVARLSALARQPVPADLLAWADRCQVSSGFPLLGTARCAEPYVALQWNGEHAARAGLGLPDLIVLTGLVAAWQHDRTLADLESAATHALRLRADLPSVHAGAPVTADVVTTAVCAGVLSGVPEDGLGSLVDLAGTLLQVRPAGHVAAGHTAAAGWLAVQVHQSGMVAYPGAFADTVATAAFTAPDLDADSPVRTLVDSLR